MRAIFTNLPVGPSMMPSRWSAASRTTPTLELGLIIPGKTDSKVAPRNLTIDVFNEAGQKTASYKVHRAWVSDFRGTADLDSNANAITIQSIKIQHEGYERDNSVKEPP